MFIFIHSLFKGWVPCDGSEIKEGIWAGKTTPDLNKSGRFLRGGIIGDVLKIEEDSLQAHTHGVSDSGHTHGYNDKYPNFGDFGENGYVGPNSADWNSDRFDKSHSATTNNAKSNIAVTAVTGARTDSETRPKNMRVVYIMKVF